MLIKSIQIEGGFLDGLDLDFKPGLNAIIGGRGTGKTSLIELIRYGLNAHSHNEESGRVSLDHALAVLEDGQITITVEEDGHEMFFARTAEESKPRASGFLAEGPIIFSQSEIENIGLDSRARLGLIDSFVNLTGLKSQESKLVADLRSISAEIDELSQNVEAMNETLTALPQVQQEISKLEAKQNKFSSQSKELEKRLKRSESLQKKIASRIQEKQKSDSLIENIEPLRKSIGDAKLAAKRLSTADYLTLIASSSVAEKIGKASKLIERSASLVDDALKEVAAAREDVDKELLKMGQQARKYRSELDEHKKGATAVAKSLSALREQEAELLGLENIRKGHAQKQLDFHAEQSSLFDQIDAVRLERFARRKSVVDDLNASLEPEVKIQLERASQLRPYVDAIVETLRGTGLKYMDTAQLLAKKVSPRELVEFVSEIDIQGLIDASGMSITRATNLISAMASIGLTPLIGLNVEDDIRLSLLDGVDYKKIEDLSTGQRCTVILSIILELRDRLVIVDQPEDHLDNAFIADTVVKAIIERRAPGQLIFSTHNANIPVLGDASLIVLLESDGERGFVKHAGALEEPASVEAITTVMEGGIEAFHRRAKFYSDGGAGNPKHA